MKESTAVGKTVTAFSLVVSISLSPPIYALSGCPDANVSDEFTLGNFSLVSTTILSDNQLEVVLQADAVNTQAGSFSSLSVTPRFHERSDLNAVIIQPMTFPPVSPFSTIQGDLANQHLTVKVDADKLDELMLRLSTGIIPVDVTANENVVLEPGVVVQGWEPWMDAFALLPGGQEPAYSPGTSVRFGMINPASTPVSLPAGFVSASNTNCSISPAAGEQWILNDDNSFEWENIPFAWRNLKINSLERIPLVDGTDDCSSSIGATIDAEIPANPLTELVESGSFCSGEEHYIDPPVFTTRTSSFEGDDIPAEVSDSNTQPVHFNDVLIGNLKISGQLQGYVLKPGIELRIRPFAGSDESSVKIRTSIDNKVNMAVTLTAQGQASILDQEIEIGALCFPLPPLNFGPLQIPWTLRLAHHIGVNAELSAGVTTGIEKQFSAGYALEWDDGVFDSEHWGESPPVEFTPPRLPHGLAATASVWSRFTTDLELGSIYPACETGAGPYLDMKLAVGLSMDPANNPRWALGHEAEITAGLEFNIMGIDIGSTVDAELVSFPGSEELTPELDNSTPSERISLNRSAAKQVDTAEDGEKQRWLIAVENKDADYPGGGFERTAVSATHDGGAAVVSYAAITGDNPLLRFDALGQLVWQQEYSNGRQPIAVTALDDDSLAVAGQPSWLAKHSADGTLSWSQDYDFTDASGGSAVCYIEDMTRFDYGTNGSGYLLIGWMHFGVNKPCAARVDDNGIVLWAKTYQREIPLDSVEGYLRGKLYAVNATSDDGFVFAGYEALLTPAAISRPLVMKIDADGEPLWSSSIDLPNVYRSGEFTDISEAEDGSLYLTGYSGAIVTQDGAMLVSHLAADGQSADSALFFPGEVEAENYLTSLAGYSPLDKGLAIESVARGVVITGVLNAHEYGIGEEAWVLRLNDRLGVEWLFSIDGPGDETINAITYAGDGLFASGVSKSLIPIEDGSDNKNSLILAKLPFEGRPGNIRSDSSLKIQYRQPAIVSGIPGADYGLNTAIVYSTVNLAINELDNIADLMDVPDNVCVTRLTPHSGADTAESVDCAVAIPEADLIPDPLETDTDSFPDPDPDTDTGPSDPDPAPDPDPVLDSDAGQDPAPETENGTGGAGLQLLLWSALLLVLKICMKTLPRSLRMAVTKIPSKKELLR